MIILFTLAAVLLAMYCDYKASNTRKNVWRFFAGVNYVLFIGGMAAILWGQL